VPAGAHPRIGGKEEMSAASLPLDFGIFWNESDQEERRRGEVRRSGNSNPAQESQPPENPFSDLHRLMLHSCGLQVIFFKSLEE
jgi:hypothetical protein